MKFNSFWLNYANPVHVYGVATIGHQIRSLRWGHTSLGRTGILIDELLRF